jgi:TPR repeat protein
MGRVGDGPGEFVFLHKAIPAAEVAYALRQKLDDGNKSCVRATLDWLLDKRNGRTELREVIAAFEATDYRFTTDPVRREQEWKKRAERYLENASLGDPLAMAALHYCYSKGLGVKADADEALRWAQLAYETGHPAGEHVLARCLLVGIGVPRNPKAADTHLERGHARKFPISTFSIGYAHYQAKRTLEAEKLLRIALDGGVGASVFYLGMMRLKELDKSRPDVARQLEEGLRLLRARAEQ